MASTSFMLYATHVGDPIRPYLYHLAQRCESVYCIVIAIHLYAQDPEAPSVRFEHYYDRGLRLFRQQLDRFDGTLVEGLMETGVLVCTLNVSRRVSSPPLALPPLTRLQAFQATTAWSVHLGHMVQVYGLDDSWAAAQEQHFPFEAMAVMDLPTFVRGRETTTLGIWERLRLAQRRAADGVETVSGLPRSLLDVFAAIEDEAAEQAFLAWPGHVGEPPHCHLWEAYRLAGILVGRRLRRRPGPASPPTDVLVARLVAALAALGETRRRPEYAHLLATNSVLYPYAAARAEVAALRRRPAWLRDLRRVVDVCEPYGRTANARILADMVEHAHAAADDAFDLDAAARARGIEICLL